MRFEVNDVLELPGDEVFDLIIDGHCLHCIIYDVDRAKLLATMRRLLKPGGAFVVETMARHPAVDLGARFLLDDDGVLWFRYADGAPEDTRVIDGEKFHPNRRIRHPQEIEEELSRAGFVIEWSQTLIEEKPGEPQNFQAILRR